MYIPLLQIQCTWKGYYVRKYVFNYYAYKKYMEGLAKKNEIVRARLREEREKAIEERLNREERIQEVRGVGLCIVLYCNW